MRRFTLASIALLVLVLVGTQVVLPGRAADPLEHGLEREGGSADVSVSALPAATLLWGSGRALEIEATGLQFDLDDHGAPSLDRLDGFGRVRMDLRRLHAGPVAIARLRLDRDERGGDYRLAMKARTTPGELVEEAGTRAGGLLGSVAGQIAGGALPEGGRTAVPFDLDVDLHSDGGRPQVTDASGSVAGVPTGPLAEIVVNAVLARL